MQMIYYTYMESPVGQLLLTGDETELTMIAFAEGKNAPEPKPGWRNDAGPLRNAADQLRAYFTGDLRDFDLPLRLQGTPFQLAVWRALQDIPYGQTISYGELARRVGTPRDRARSDWRMDRTPSRLWCLATA
jgi:methylated-DNA-[protein]-cysteine S-methyltransferase